MLLGEHSREAPGFSRGECHVSVDDVDATARQAEALGGQVLMAPRDIPEVGRFCVIRDPQGAVISAITYLRR